MISCKIHVGRRGTDQLQIPEVYFSVQYYIFDVLLEFVVLEMLHEDGHCPQEAGCSGPCWWRRSILSTYESTKYQVPNRTI